MRELLPALVEDTAVQIGEMRTAIAGGDGARCRALAHYSKGACASLGAKAAASLLLDMEKRAPAGEMDACGRSLTALAEQLEMLRHEIDML